ncbi:hypothetical protein [Cellulomonas soli]|uniref:Integral membrane protein n=1 Tax=Cellulomonas soli TaxID=931535 RepID=A0A512PC92_9CELL|nr:hypothetical protein [Cellulomonas soli]NYI58407.1 hypothetical protein [Cellulomonas soli]GEP68829.1 hypothetical protein CSO01_15440 [Cellulomonas soli]
MNWYHSVVVATGRAPALFALLGFLLTFVVTRSVTRRIRARSLRSGDPTPSTPAPAPDEGQAGRRVLRDIHIGGVHVHHQVWGILLVLLTGLLEFRYSPDSPGSEILAVFFGAGAALALDEFALWLHLEDVYWSAEGRKSIDAILVATAIGVVLLLQASPVGVDRQAETGTGLYVATIALHLVAAVICLLKGKLATGLIGVALPFIALVGALRLAEPQSFWARRWYGEHKAARSTARYGSGAYTARYERIRDFIAGSNP